MRELEGRTLGDFGSGGKAATLVVVAGLHGNEPAGVLACLRVARALNRRARALRGRVLLLAGNLGALRAGVRYLDRDLNRAWTRTRVHALRNGGPPEGAWTAEDLEQRDLLELLDPLLERDPRSVRVLDLHTTSGEGGPFCTIADRLSNRALALALPVPMVLGLEELVDGTLHDHLGKRGCVSLAFECGQHRESRAVERAEAAIWIVLATTGLLAQVDVPELAGARKLLTLDCRRLPRLLEMRHRHPIERGDDFHMRPGYRNFQPIRRGEILAEDATGPLRASESARVLMPLYQRQGHDGFFVVRDFSPAWLRVSQALRRLRLARFVHWLPGIRKHPRRPEAFVVDRHVARWYALQVLHLLGFRRHYQDGERLVVLRRR